MAVGSLDKECFYEPAGTTKEWRCAGNNVWKGWWKRTRGTLGPHQEAKSLGGGVGWEERSQGLVVYLSAMSSSHLSTSTRLNKVSGNHVPLFNNKSSLFPKASHSNQMPMFSDVSMSHQIEQWREDRRDPHRHTRLRFFGFLLFLPPRWPQMFNPSFQGDRHALPSWIIPLFLALALSGAQPEETAGIAKPWQSPRIEEGFATSGS